MIEIYIKYDNMHIFGMINAFNCINNHVISCINSMLSRRKDNAYRRARKHKKNRMERNVQLWHYDDGGRIRLGNKTMAIIPYKERKERGREGEGEGEVR